jgi:hypothetical protein
MITARLATLRGEWIGECEVREDAIFMTMETTSPISFSYGVLLPSNSTVPVPVRQKTSKFKDGVTSVQCHRLSDQVGQVYNAFIECNEYQYRIHKQTLDLFVKYGAATSKVVDKIMVCPECESIAFTIRPGCPSCGSHATRPDQLVHHYACGNVDLLETFTINRQQGSIACGKCHKDGLIINVDYDVSAGLQRCMDCGWTGNNSKLIGRCLCCDTSFLVTEAKEINLMEYTML